MKKSICFLLALTLMAGISTAFAAEISVEKFFDTGLNTAVILSKDGVLFFSLGINSSEKSFVTDNVRKAYDDGGFIHVIKNDGSYEIYDVRWHGHCDLVNSFKGDYKDFFNSDWKRDEYEKLHFKEALLLDNDNNLILLYINKNSGEYEEKLILSSVKSYTVNYDTDVNYGINGYAITVDNIMYSVNYNYETKFIMSEVDSYYYGRYQTSCVLKTNGDVYILRDVPSKVLSNVRLEGGIINSDESCNFITNDNKWYFSNFRDPNYIKTVLLGENFDKIFPDNKAIDKDGNLFNGGTNSISSEYLDGYRLSNILNGRYINDSGYYIRKQGNKYEAVEKLGIIKDVIKVGNSTLFINSDGEVWEEVLVSLDYANFYKTGLSDKVTKLLLNGEALQLTQKLQNANGRTMYPFRECLEAMGATVMWDGEKQIAIGEVPGIKIEFPIGKSEYYINGVRYEMDTSAYVDESIGRTYIPIRYAAEGLGFVVDWMPGDVENTISIHK